MLLQFPEPPDLAKGATGSTIFDELRLSHLLKDEDFEEKHPRTGTHPYPNRFANKPKKDVEPNEERAARKDWPSPPANNIIRRVFLSFLKRSMKRSPGEGGWVRSAIALADLAAAVWEALHEEVPDENFDVSGKRIDAQLGAESQLPKTLAELQVEPTDDLIGFEEHHIVGQNESNLSKDSRAPIYPVRKFGADVLDDPSNLVWIPRLTHELITNKYNSTAPGDPDKRLYRDVVSEMDFYQQRQAGLAALREFGVLK